MAYDTHKDIRNERGNYFYIGIIIRHCVFVVVKIGSQGKKGIFKVSNRLNHFKDEWSQNDFFFFFILRGHER